MDLTILSKVLELAANLAYLTALWLLRRDRWSEDEGDGVLMIEGPKPRTTVVIVRSEDGTVDGTDDVIISIDVTR